MNQQYTKSNPKLQDYNPLTHTSFYNQQSRSPSPRSGGSPVFLPNIRSSPSINQRSTYLLAKNMFSVPSNSENSRSFEGLDSRKSELPKYSKIYIKNQITNPISGEVKVFNVDRPKLEYLDKAGVKDKLTKDFDEKYAKRYREVKESMKPRENIAGSLRKEVPYVPYVNPYVLKSSFKEKSDGVPN